MHVSKSQVVSGVELGSIGSIDMSWEVFDDYEDDQYDFHAYSLRRFMLNIYMKCALFMRRYRSTNGSVNI